MTGQRGLKLLSLVQKKRQTRMALAAHRKRLAVRAFRQGINDRRSAGAERKAKIKAMTMKPRMTAGRK